jgi:hypothetical protein
MSEDKTVIAQSGSTTLVSTSDTQEQANGALDVPTTEAGTEEAPEHPPQEQEAEPTAAQVAREEQIEARKPGKAQRRIGQLAAALKEQRAEVAKLKSEVERARAENPAPPSDFAARAAAVRQRAPDFDQTLSSSAVRIPTEVHAELQQLSHGADMAYLLAKNPAEAERLLSLPPEEAVRQVRAANEEFELRADPRWNSWAAQLSRLGQGDIDALYAAPEGFEITNDLRKSLLDAPVNVAVYLARHPDQLRTLQALPPRQRTLELGRLTERVGVGREASRAPAPIKTVGSSAVTAEIDLDKVPYPEYRKQREAQERGRYGVKR